MGAGGAEKSGSFSSGATDAVALTSSVSSGAPLVDAWEFLQRLGWSHQPWNLYSHQQAESHHRCWHVFQQAKQSLQPEDSLVAMGLQHL